MRRFILPALIVFLSTALAVADDDQSLSDRLCKLDQWKIVSGNWITTKAGHLRAAGGSTIDFPSDLPTGATISFKMVISKGKRARMTFHGTGIEIADEGDEHQLDVHGKFTDRTGDPAQYRYGGLVTVSARFENGTFTIHLNDNVITGKCETPQAIRLSLATGTSDTPSAIAEYFDFKVVSGAEAPKPASPSTASTEPPLIPGDIVVTCEKPATQPTSMPVSTADVNAVERPEYRDVPRPLMRSLTSVTAMMVTVDADGEATGVTGDIIATVPADSRRVDRATIGFARPDGDEMMKSSLEEATHAVLLRYPIWEPGRLTLSFGEKFTAHGGPSAGTAFGLLMLSILENVELDPACAVTGDITVDWKVRKVGGVTAKLRGATLDGCKVALIPTSNEQAFTDMGVLYGHAAYWKMQVFSINTMQEALSLARKDRSAGVEQAMEEFRTLADKLDAAEAITLRAPETKAALQHILELAPNHLSAKNLLAVVNNTAPTKLSTSATLYKLSIIMYPYRTIAANNKAPDVASIAQTAVRTRKQIVALRPIADKSLLPLINTVDDFADALKAFEQKRMSAPAMLAKAKKVDAGFADMTADPAFVEKVVHEGY